MKTKKLFLPAIILIVALLVTVIFLVIFSIAKKPTITEAEFPFSITYELDGETVTISEVYKARYVRNDGYADTKTRVYEGSIGDTEESGSFFTLKKEENGRIELWTHLYADYLMGDPEYDYFDDKPFEPRIGYYDAEEQEHTDEETLAAHGVKLISFEYPTPIENPLVFSHFSYFSGSIVLPILLIALLALVAIIIFVRKEKELKYKTVDVFSIILNFVVFFTLVPLVTVLGMFIDIAGGSPEFYHQVAYFIPSFSVLCIAVSVALRRKGYGVKSLIAQLVAPALFIVYLIACGVIEMF